MTIFAMRQAMVSAPAGDRSSVARLVLFGLVALLIVAMGLSLFTGASNVSAIDAMRIWLGLVAPDDASAVRAMIIINDIRLPRMVLGVLVGAGLAVSGVVMQGMFRNPLADPGLVGVSAGAGLGAVLFIVLGGTALAPLVAIMGIYSIPLAAFGGGALTTIILYRVSTSRGQTAIATMLLAGIAIGALSGAVTGMLVYIANDAQLRDLTFWGLGSLAGANWTKILAAGPLMVAGIVVSMMLWRGLNALTLGEASAHHMGIDVQRLKNTAIGAVAACVGAAVAVSGGIGFVGIVVPHLLRILIGPDHKYLLPASAILGAAFLLFADAVSRIIVAPAELPIGIVTASVGGPFFLYILLRRRHHLAW
ncbi:FecCD family ABC transporter permease [Pelagibacterium lentulum]|uniref:Heme ABC transporter permease n=1 Tax=Pelagibacterium lentulum TaxID=2029865 RepID=A0A916VV52_9HYPH|nr:iron ABC transporter permease [Pelagibacterium lentulum]GGA39006.1 heme ABC transporter permease [Pelagibacterium lentulum]